MLHPGVLQPGGPPRVRRDQGRPARPAPGVRGRRRRQDPAQPGADRALFRRGPRRREAVRHRAQAGARRPTRPSSRSPRSILGVAFTSGLEEVVIPFFDRGLPVEYELTRSIRVVSRSDRKKVGILNTDAKMMGGFDMRSMGQNPEWSIVTELKKQYEVSSVSPDAPIPTDLDVLLVAQPSSLTQKQIDNLTDYVKKGGPTLLFLDPLPVDNPPISPESPQDAPRRPVRRRPAARAQGRPPARCSTCSASTGRRPRSSGTRTTRIRSSPTCRPRSSSSAAGSGAKDAFNPDQIATSGLQEIVMLFPGCFGHRGGAGPSSPRCCGPTTRAARSPGPRSSQQGFMGDSRRSIAAPASARRRQLHPGRPDQGEARGRDAQARSDPPRRTSPKTPRRSRPTHQRDRHRRPRHDLRAVLRAPQTPEDREPRLRQRHVRAQLRRRPGRRRLVRRPRGRSGPKHRTLEAVEAQTKKLHHQEPGQTKAAEDAAKEELDRGPEGFDKQGRGQVKSRQADLDERTKEIMLANLQEVAQRRLDVEKATIEDEKLTRHPRGQGRLGARQAIGRIQSRIKASRS